MLDFDNSGSIEIDSFAIGLQQLHGDAKSIDISRLRHEVVKTQKKLAKLTQLDGQFHDLCRHIYDQVCFMRHSVENSFQQSCAAQSPPHDSICGSNSNVSPDNVALTFTSDNTDEKSVDLSVECERRESEELPRQHEDEVSEPGARISIESAFSDY